MDLRDAFLRQNDRFVTQEEEIARTTDTSAVYWRLEDQLCRQFLTAGAAEARHGNGPSLAGSFFPFYRKAAVLALPRFEEGVPQWLLLAFFAGMTYGQHCLDEAEVLFEENRQQEQVAWDFLASLRNRLSKVGIGRGRLATALLRCCERRNDCSEQDVLSRIIVHTQTAIWAGLLATTRARSDVLLMEFSEGINAAIPLSRFSLPSRLVVNAAAEANKRPVLDLLLHPLLDMAVEKYADSPLEGTLMLRYLNQNLRQLPNATEEDCPTGDLDLAHWIFDAFKFAENRGIHARLFQSGRGRRLPVFVRIHPVVNDPDPILADIEQPENVGLGFCGNRHDSVGHFHRVALDPAGKIVTASQLFSLPGPKRFKQVNGIGKEKSLD